MPYIIPTTPEQIAQFSGNIVFQPGIAAAVLAGQLPNGEGFFNQFQAGVDKLGYTPPDPGVGTSQFGTPIMGNLQIASGTYTVFDPVQNKDVQIQYPQTSYSGQNSGAGGSASNGTTGPSAGAGGSASSTIAGTNGSQGGIIIDTVLFTVDQPKHIVSTYVQGLPNTVKEYISQGDFLIKVEGVITSGTNGVYPQQAVTALIQTLNAPVALKIQSNYLTRVFGITSVVTMRYSFPQHEGSYSYQKFSIEFASDLPVPLQLNIPNT